jgi:hypothetical protein
MVLLDIERMSHVIVSTAEIFPEHSSMAPEWKLIEMNRTAVIRKDDYSRDES